MAGRFKSEYRIAEIQEFRNSGIMGLKKTNLNILIPQYPNSSISFRASDFEFNAFRYSLKPDFNNGEE
jgi:hypothetical protein